MNRYFFIIPRTPKQFKSDIREELWKVTIKSLLEQTYSNWKALIICDESESIINNDNLLYLESTALIKGEKIDFAVEYIVENNLSPDYLIRFDDDDIIMPNALETADKFNFDVFGDKYHTFFDLSSGLMSQQDSPWLANTVIHKVDHALKVFSDTGKSLLNHDHSHKWHKYYEDKKVVYSDKQNPVYVRVLSPKSVTALIGDNYESYLNNFGIWHVKVLEDFKLFTEELSNIKQKYSLDFGFKAKSKWLIFFKKIIKYIK